MLFLMLMTVVAPHYVCGVRVVLGHCFLIYLELCILGYTEESWLHYLVLLLSCVCLCSVRLSRGALC